MKISALLPAAVLTALAACSGGTDAPSTAEVLGKSLVSSFNRPDANAPAMTRAQLAQAGTPVMEVRVERVGATGYLAPGARQSDSLGQTTTWLSSDRASFTFRRGVLIASRGFGFDLISASAPVAGSGPMGPAYAATRHYVARADDFSQIKLDLECSLSKAGAQRIDILGESHAVQHLVESCISPEGGKITNEYWIGTQDGVMWQSRQWAGPRMGYVNFRRVIK